MSVTACAYIWSYGAWRLCICNDASLTTALSLCVPQLERDSANPAHPLNRFATGNKDTLHTEAVAQGIDLRSRLLDFHRNYYTAERMTLAVQGNQPLADLERWVKGTFLDINSSLGTSGRLQKVV
jgi:secreted Zn-dependent insulinase-like peptidase